MRFIDLFCGIGAFHTALKQLDSDNECVFASEIDKWAINTYEKNYKMNCNYDITKVDEKDIPAHDILCAGFPCQPFSNAGHKKGFTDTRGTLFFEIERILKYHRPKYIILENVKHLVKHDNGNTYKVIMDSIHKLGYITTKEPLIISPHQLGIPQNRERLFIVGIHKQYIDSDYIKIEMPKESKIKNIYEILDKTVDTKYSISKYEEMVLTAWNEFKINLQHFSTPVLFDEFGQTYDYSHFPLWKQKYCEKNRKLYLENKEFIDVWAEKYKVKDFKLRDRKFEWQAGTYVNTVWDCLIQLRQSGIRCKKPITYPALVAMVQTSIVGKRRRRITPREAARLQSFPETFILDSNEQKAYKQLGNSINVEVILHIAKQLLALT